MDLYRENTRLSARKLSARWHVSEGRNHAWAWKMAVKNRDIDEGLTFVWQRVSNGASKKFVNVLILIKKNPKYESVKEIAGITL
jgi:hypothetical protein